MHREFKEKIARLPQLDLRSIINAQGEGVPFQPRAGSATRAV
jgi:hypothetical protein